MNNTMEKDSLIAIHSKKKQLYMDRNTSSTIGGYASAIIAVLGAIINIITFIVLGSNKKLKKCPTTVIVLALTAFNIVYNVLILPFQSVMYLERRYVFYVKKITSQLVFLGFSWVLKAGVNSSPLVYMPIQGCPVYTRRS